MGSRREASLLGSGEGWSGSRGALGWHSRALIGEARLAHRESPKKSADIEGRWICRAQNRSWIGFPGLWVIVGSQCLSKELDRRFRALNRSKDLETTYQGIGRTREAGSEILYGGVESGTFYRGEMRKFSFRSRYEASKWAAGSPDLSGVGRGMGSLM
jgi:hypothetical protein